MDYFELTSPCGIDCFNCKALRGNITAELRAALARTSGGNPADIGCDGCRTSGCLLLPEGGCPTKKCVEEHGVAFCHECDEFPCRRLQPALDGADRYPQNFKLFNLCRIRKVGLATWASEEATRIRARYEHGTIALANGPFLEDDHV